MSDEDLVPRDQQGGMKHAMDKLAVGQKEKKVNDAREKGRKHRQANENGTGTSSGRMSAEDKKRYEGKAKSGNMSPEEKKAYREGYSEG